MKRNLIYFLFLALMITSIISCSKNKSGKGTEWPHPDSTFQYNKSGYANIIIDSLTAAEYINIYENKIRRSPVGIINDKLSHSVWFDTAAIKFLARYINDSTQYSIDGIRMHFIAYDKKGRAPGQYKDHQLSLVMVPTVNHKDDWNILAPLYLKYQKYFGGGLNHGELCPDSCQ